MKVQMINIDQIKPYPSNPRKISDKAIRMVGKSIAEYGFRQPLVVDKDNVIIIGHTRFHASRQLGLKEVPCNVADISKEKAKALRIADNRINEETAWDDDKLIEELNSLIKDEYNVDALGFTQEELDSLFTKENIDIPIAEDEDINYIDNDMNDVKMIQIFYNPEDEKKFREGLNNVRDHYNIDNISDAVLRCVLNENDKIKSSND